MGFIRRLFGLPEKSDLIKFREYEKDDIIFIRQLEDLKNKFTGDELYYGVHIKLLIDNVISRNK